MKHYIPLIIAGMLLIGGFGIGTVAGDSSFIAEKTVIFADMKITANREYARIELSGANSFALTDGEVVLPSYVQTFEFPFGTHILDVSCDVSDVHEQLVNREIVKTPTPVLAGFSSTSEDTEEVDHIDALDPYPGVWYDYTVGCGIVAGEQRILVDVEVYPVQYYPADPRVRWAERIDIEVDYAPVDETQVTEDEYLLVVIGPAEFSTQIEPLITHKNSRGVSSIAVTLEEIYDGTYFSEQGRDDAEMIKYFIKNAIESWGTSYVLLMGGDYEVPARITHVRATSGDTELFASDLYYADIYNETSQFCSWDSNENDIFGEYDWGTSHLTDDVDLYPDVYVGRLACIDTTEVTTVVNKIIQYEISEAFTQEWFTNLVVCGGDSFPGDDESIAEGEFVNEAVIDVMDGFIPTRLWATNGGLSGIPAGTTKISNAINDGAGFVDFSGHGNPSVWATHPHEDDGTWLPTASGGYWNSPHVSGLNNGDQLPIVVIGACSVSKYTDRPDCFTWSFVSNPDGGGIGAFGATGLGWAYIGEWVTEGLIEGMALNTFEAYKEGATTLGEMWGKAITNYVKPQLEGTDYKSIEEWQLFGDPSLAVAAQSESPAKPATPDGEISGRIGVEYTYTSVTTDPEGDEIYYLFDWGDDTYSGWLGPFSSGDEVEASHRWSERGSYEIRVKAKDEHGVQSEWSDPLSASMPVQYSSYPLLERLLQRFPLLALLLEYLQ